MAETMSGRLPTVTVGMPVLNEAAHLGACLSAIAAQTYAGIVEVLVADGGSSDDSREIARRYPKVKVLDNPRHNRPAGLNVAIAAAAGEIFVRVDARTLIEADYVQRCVNALEQSGAAIVGGPLLLAAVTAKERGIEAAMTSRIGAGPAEFRRKGGEPRYVDTVYLGAFRLSTIRQLGGYDEWFGGNEDAELAWRAQGAGGVYLDPAIRSTYAVREGLRPLWRQFRRYGKARTTTILKHPASISARQLAIPALLVGVLSPWRKPVLICYGSLVAARSLLEAVAEGPVAGMTLAMALPTMHAAWAAGALESFARGTRRGASILGRARTSNPTVDIVPIYTD